MSGWRRSAAAGLLLLAVYVGLSFLNSPRGFLGTDTGGKVATLKVMDESGRFDPDLGYWAEEWDPTGTYHPIALTSHVGDRWVNVTTLPALWVGWLLYDVGGYRAALLVPMVGSIATAFAMRRLVRQLGGSERWAWRGFALVGLASPMTIYALDFWEHSIGVALLAWSAVLLLRVDDERARGGALGRAVGLPLAAGVLAGIATTMRTEALVYAATFAAAWAGAALLRRPRVMAPAAVGLVAFSGGVLAMFGAGAAIERAVLASSIRPARAAGTAISAGTAGASTRLEEAVITTVGFGGRVGAALGAVTIVLLVVGGAAAVRARSRLLANGSLVLAAVSYVTVIADGLGFVPGLATAAPVATRAGAKIGPDRLDRRPLALLAVALVPVPLVLAFQYVGGAGPQWGGRYLLPTSLLLMGLGWARLEGAERVVRTTLVGLSIAVTAYGVAWLSVRSHQVEEAITALEGRQEQVLVSGVGHLAREGGATYGDRRWLTMNPPSATTPGLLQVLEGARIDTVATIELPGSRPLDLPGFEVVDRSEQPLFTGLELSVTSWRRTG